jgi:uncharacterized protein (TIGR02118 family)
MIKLVYCVRRREDVPPEEFHRYWLEEHGALMRRVTDAVGIQRYIQSHTIEPEVNEALRASRGLAEPYDGITEVWFDSAADLLAGMETPEGQEAHRQLLDDEARFVDFANSRVFMTEEHEIISLQEKSVATGASSRR